MTDLITLTTQVPLETLREGLKKRMIVESPNVRVSEFFFDQGTSTKGHTHDVEQAAYIVAGKFKVDLNGEVVEVGPDGDERPGTCSLPWTRTDMGGHGCRLRGRPQRPKVERPRCRRLRLSSLDTSRRRVRATSRRSLR